MWLRLPFLFVGFYFLSVPLGAVEWAPEKRVQIRSEMLQCKTFLATMVNGELNDSVGIPLSSHDVAELKASLIELLSEQGKEPLMKAQLFVTGLSMGGGEEALAPFKKVLEELDLADAIEIKPLTVPETTLQKFVYWFPSVARDYQTPEKSEVISGLITTAAVEFPNVIYLYKTLGPTDFWLTFGTHTTLLAALTIYKKFLVNWILRPGSSVIGKQAAVSVPFILNYNVFANSTKIQAFVLANGWMAVVAALPHQLVHFSVSQSLTLFLQTLFYSVVISRGVRGWENSQVGETDSRLARTVSNYITMPILALDAIILAMAAANGHSLAELGPFTLNTGHVGLASLTLVGSSLVLYPKLMDPFLRMYKWILSCRGKCVPNIE